jgi:hypothetical protein
MLSYLKMTQISPDRKNPASFRDPDGFIFSSNGRVYRRINESYRENYECLMNSGLYGALVKRGDMVSHEEIRMETGLGQGGFKVIAPQQIPFVSFPYEWCFSQLKDAALLTLELQAKAMEHGMTLKDASGYNIQFLDSHPVHIDTLSFEKYREGQPWDAYGQFCRHFLAPLALMAMRDVRLNSLSRVFLDGTPLDLASTMLPFKTIFRPGLLMHIHLHSKSQRNYSAKAKSSEGLALSKRGFQGIIHSLRSAVESLTWRNSGTEWGEYYRDTNYSEAAATSKSEIIKEMLESTGAKSCWDLGSNNGLYSRIASEMGIRTVSFDLDHGVVESNYLACRTRKSKDILPLLMDLANPSPALGWSHLERPSLLDRGPADVCMALALIHHLSFSNNLPFQELADFFSLSCRFLIIEFVPKTDSQAQRLLKSRKDIFTNYEETHFKESFASKFEILDARKIDDSERKLFLMERS